MNILGIAGSARKNGNSEILLDKVLEGARSRGAVTEKIVLNRFNIKPCGGGGRCHKTGICYIKDDMTAIYKKLKNADAIIVASPVYFGSLPGQLKIMIDRCQSIWAENFIIKKKKPRLAKKGIFLSVSSHKNESFFENSRQIIEIFFMVLGIRLFRQMYIPDLEHRKDILRKKKALDNAYRYGAELAEAG